MQGNGFAREPLDIEEARVPRGQVHIIPQRCKGCDFCIQFCPVQMLEFSDEVNKKGLHFPSVKKGMEEACTHCQFCNLLCPEMAIYTTDTAAKEGEGEPHEDQA
jgi:2-oxoglutarate ferredoxin oxidoreductase subunit delta